MRTSALTLLRLCIRTGHGTLLAHRQATSGGSDALTGRNKAGAGCFSDHLDRKLQGLGIARDIRRINP